MRYRNKKTGVEIETNGVIRGGDWETVATKHQQKTPKNTKKQVKKDE